MERKRKFCVKYFIIFILAFLLFGCASNDSINDSINDIPMVDGINIEDEEADILNTDNVVDTAESDIIGERGSSGEIIAENTEFEYSMSEGFIVNFNEAFMENEIFSVLKVPDDIVGEEDIVGEFCEGFPEELQQLLLNNYDSKTEGDDEWKSYLLQDYEIITDDGASNISFDELESDIGDNYNSLRVVDIDSDGENEYVSIKDVGTAHLTQVDVIKYYDDRWHVIANGTAYSNGAAVGILEYEGDKYILMENVLVCWNSEYDSANTDDIEWNAMAVNRKVVGYTPNELYSRGEDSIDYLAGVDLENLKNNAERYPIGGSFSGYLGTWFMVAEYDWEAEYNGKTYLYVISNFSNMGGFPQDDYLLTIFEEGDGSMEAVKVYYLKGYYCLTFEDNQCGPYGLWKRGGRG